MFKEAPATCLPKSLKLFATFTAAPTMAALYFELIVLSYQSWSRLESHHEELARIKGGNFLRHLLLSHFPAFVLVRQLNYWDSPVQNLPMSAVCAF